MAPANIHGDPHALLLLAERRAAAVAQALIGGQPGQLETAARELQSAAAALSDALQRPAAGSSTQGRDFRMRLQAVAQVLAAQREACLRRFGAVERSLNSILPATRASTYAGAANPYARAGAHGRGFRAC